MVTVVMPVYNSEAFIAEAIESLLNQTFQNFELIILDDCSTDSSMAIATANTDPRIKVIHSAKKQGQANLINKGISLAKNEFIAIAHSDDINMPERLERQVEFLTDNKHIGLAGTAMQAFGSDFTEKLLPVSEDTVEVAGDLLFYCTIAHPSVMLRKSLLVNNNAWYKQEFVPCEDYELWRRLVPFTKLSNISYVGVQYRMHAGQISQTKKELTSKLEQDIRQLYFEQEFSFLAKNDIKFFETIFYLSDATRIDVQFISGFNRIQQLIRNNPHPAGHSWNIWINRRLKKTLLSSSNYSFGAGGYSFFKNPGSRKEMCFKEKLSVLYRSFIKFS